MGKRSITGRFGKIFRRKHLFPGPYPKESYYRHFPKPVTTLSLMFNPSEGRTAPLGSASHAESNRLGRIVTTRLAKRIKTVCDCGDTLLVNRNKAQEGVVSLYVYIYVLISY